MLAALSTLRFAPADDQQYYRALLYEMIGHYPEARAEWIALRGGRRPSVSRRRALDHVAALDAIRRTEAVKPTQQPLVPPPAAPSGEIDPVSRVAILAGLLSLISAGARGDVLEARDRHRQPGSAPRYLRERDEERRRAHARGDGPLGVARDHAPARQSRGAVVSQRRRGRDHRRRAVVPDRPVAVLVLLRMRRRADPARESVAAVRCAGLRSQARGGGHRSVGRVRGAHAPRPAAQRDPRREQHRRGRGAVPSRSPPHPAGVEAGPRGGDPRLREDPRARRCLRRDRAVEPRGDLHDARQARSRDRYVSRGAAQLSSHGDAVRARRRARPRRACGSGPRLDRVAGRSVAG